MPDLPMPDLAGLDCTESHFVSPGGPVTGDEVLASMADPRWLADRDAVLALVALRERPLAPRLWASGGYTLTGLMLWQDASSTATPPEGVIDLLDGWYNNSNAHNRLSAHAWQVVLYGLVHDFLLPAMGATHYVLEFHPNSGAESAVRASLPRPHHSDPVRYSTLVRVEWPQVLARTVATINAFDRERHAP